MVWYAVLILHLHLGYFLDFLICPIVLWQFMYWYYTVLILVASEYVLISARLTLWPHYLIALFFMVFFTILAHLFFQMTLIINLKKSPLMENLLVFLLGLPNFIKLT